MVAHGTWGSDPADRLIVALDCGQEEALQLGKHLAGKVKWVKVGMTLYYQAGPQIVKQFKNLGFNVFLDLKLHDIPHQIRGAAFAAAASGADMLTAHTAGGRDMLKAFVEGAAEGASSISKAAPITLGITVLTSIGDETLADIGVSRSMSDQVSHLACMAVDAGLSGVVSSPLEAKMLRQVLGDEAFIVTPGVRPVGADVGDQTRISTPAGAITDGSSHLVVGRPITKADDPQLAAEGILSEIGTVM